jgi:hypothetical protein
MAEVDELIILGDELDGATALVEGDCDLEPSG